MAVRSDRPLQSSESNHHWLLKEGCSQHHRCHDHGRKHHWANKPIIWSADQLIVCYMFLFQILTSTVIVIFTASQSQITECRPIVIAGWSIGASWFLNMTVNENIPFSQTHSKHLSSTQNHDAETGFSKLVTLWRYADDWLLSVSGLWKDNLWWCHQVITLIKCCVRMTAVWESVKDLNGMRPWLWCWYTRDFSSNKTEHLSLMV